MTSSSQLYGGDLPVNSFCVHVNSSLQLLQSCTAVNNDCAAVMRENILCVHYINSSYYEVLLHLCRQNRWYGTLVDTVKHWIIQVIRTRFKDIVTHSTVRKILNHPQDPAPFVQYTIQNSLHSRGLTLQYNIFSLVCQNAEPAMDATCMQTVSAKFLFTDLNFFCIGGRVL